MRSIRFSSPSPALVISVLSLFVALGGTGYAATQLGGPAAQQAKKHKKKKANDTKADKKLFRSMIGSAHVAFAQTAGNASTAGNAQALGGLAPGSFAARKDSGSVVLTNGGSAPLLTVGPVSYAASCSGNTVTVTIADSAGGTVTGTSFNSHTLSATPSTDWTMTSGGGLVNLFPEAVIVGDGTAFTASVILALHQGTVACSARVIAITAG